MRKLTILMILVAAAAVALAQGSPKAAAPVTQANPFTAHTRWFTLILNQQMMRSAEHRSS